MTPVLYIATVELYKGRQRTSVQFFASWTWVYFSLGYYFSIDIDLLLALGVKLLSLFNVVAALVSLSWNPFTWATNWEKNFKGQDHGGYAKADHDDQEGWDEIFEDQDFVVHEGADALEVG